jgi:hypothetical protein
MVQFNTPAGSADIVFIFLDRISQCQTKWTAEITRNLSDYVLSKINSHGFNVLQGLDEDALLREAAKTYSHAVVLSTGTEFINGDDFFNEVENLVYSNTDFFLMGHIPDRDDGYYELHEQCYIINLKTYSELDYPIVGKFAYYSPHTQIQPLRAEDNVHDDYTPVWVESGNIIKQYKHKWHGWNILSEAFKHDKPVLVFPEQFRKNKRYYYPNYESAFTNACTYLYGKNQVAAQTLFYPYNTETVIEVDAVTPLQQLVIQASGLQFIEYLLEYGYSKDTVVRFVDYNLFALECMKHIIDNWDGADYLKFVKEYVSSRQRFLKNQSQEWITLTGVEQPVDSVIWQNIMSTVTFEFCHQDLVLNKGLAVNQWLDAVPNTIIHLSHIFNYDPVAPFTPARYRVCNENKLIEKIKEYNPSASIVLVGRLSELYKNSLPTWHQDGEWNVD